MPLTQNSNEKYVLKPYITLDMWRGLASLCVVVLHAGHIIKSRFVNLATDPFYQVCEFGYLGVQIFFVISGYCIAGAACSIVRRNDGWRNFVMARLRRLYPPFWFSLVLISVLSILAQALVATGRLHGSMTADMNVLHHSLIFYLSNLTLTQLVLHHSSLSVVSWTLCYEIAFYMIVSLLLIKWLRGACGEGKLLTGLHVITISALTMLILAPQIRIFPLDLWPQFGLGAIVYDTLKHPHQTRPKWWLAAIGLTTFAFILSRHIMMGPYDEPSRLTFGVALGFALLILCLYRHDDRLCRFSAVRALISIGIFSYSLYLTHYITLGLVNQAFRFIHLSALFHLLFMGASITAALLFARLFYQLCEQPFLRTVHKTPHSAP